MGVFDDVASDDMAYGFMSTDVFAEQITYTPKGGAARTIPAVVRRLEPDPVEGPGQSSPVVEVDIHKTSDTTKGTDSINRRGDVFNLKPRLSGDAKDMRINEILEEDATRWLLELR